MRGRNEIDVMAATLLQLQHDFSQTLVRNFVFELFFVRLRNLVVLAVNTSQVAVAEENISGTVGADERRFLAKMSCVGRNNRQPARVARRDLVVQAIIETITRTNRAALEQRFKRGYTFLQLARLKQG